MNKKALREKIALHELIVENLEETIRIKTKVIVNYSRKLERLEEGYGDILKLNGEYQEENISLKDQVSSLETAVDNYQSLYADLAYNYDDLSEKYQFLIDQYNKLKRTVVKVFKNNKRLSTKVKVLELEEL